MISVEVQDRSGVSAQDSVEIVVFEDNQPPNCEITSPYNGDIVASGRTQIFIGIVEDSEQPFDLLTVDWYSDQHGLLGSALPSPDGSVSIEYSDLAAGEHIITLRADDGFGGVCEANHILSVQEAPTIGISSPIYGATFTYQEPVPTNLTVSDLEDLPQDLEVTISSSVDGLLFSGSSDEQGLISTGSNELIQEVI